MERLQKLIAQAGVCSRRAAEELIAAGRVTVDGKIVRELGAKADVTQKICVDGKILHFDAKKIYLLLNKPRGYVSTAHDDRGRKTVIDLLDKKQRDVASNGRSPQASDNFSFSSHKNVTQNFFGRVWPVGRLDLNSEGLLILTNDGELTNALIHPRFGVEKTYRAKISGTVTEEKLDLLRAGVELDDGLTAPAEIYLLDADTVEVTIHEGRNRQVRRMFAAVGCDVKRLRRIRFAGLTLDGVKVGHFRELTTDEIAALKKFCDI